MFKVGDIVSFQSMHETGEVLLVGEKDLLVRVTLGRGHDGIWGWTRRLGWAGDDTNSCWFVRQSGATVIKSKPAFKGNTK